VRAILWTGAAIAWEVLSLIWIVLYVTMPDCYEPECPEWRFAGYAITILPPLVPLLLFTYLLWPLKANRRPRRS
jgi:hypothetical protein